MTTARTPYLGTKAKAAAPPPSKKGGGFWHDVAKYSGAELAGNLAKDVGHTAVGAVPGLIRAGGAVAADAKALATLPVPGHVSEGAKVTHVHKDVIAPMVHQYKDYYGHDVAHHLYTHPLQPILDALTVGTGGVGAVAKIGKVAADAGMIADTSRLARLGQRAEITTRSPRAIATGKGPKHTDITSTRPLVKARETAVGKLRSSKRMVERPGGEFAKYGRQVQAEATQHALGKLADYQPYFKATHRLSEREWNALHIRSYDVHPDDLVTHVWGKDSPAGKIASDPKVRELVLHPTTKLLRAEVESRKLSEAGGKLAVRHKMVTEAALAERPALMTRLAEGQRFEKPTPGKLGTPSQSLIKARARVDRLQSLHERALAKAAEKAVPYGKVHTRTGYQAPKLSTAPELALRRQHLEVTPGPKTPGVASDLPARGATTSPTVQRLGGALSVARDELARLEKAAARKVKPTGFVGDATQMHGPIRQLHGNPYYVPDTMEPTKAISPVSTSGGKGVTKDLGSQKQNTGALALSGKLHLRSDILGPEFLRRVKKVKYDEIHNALRRGAVRITPQELEASYGGKLPKGWEYLPVKPGKASGPAEEPGLRLPPLSRGQSETSMPIHDLIPNPEDLHRSELAKTGFSTTEQAQALTSGGRYYIVPTRMVKAATGEFTRSSEFTHRFIKQPLSVWRSLVLGLRVGFLTNNLVGNSMMYAVKIGGTGALRDLFMAIKESHGDGVAKKALDSAATPPALRQSLYQEFFPEQLQNTFGRTQSPSASAITNATGTVAKGFRAVTSPIPRLTNAVAETGFRKALIRNTIRRSPEFKKVYQSMPKQERTFTAAAQRVLEGKGGKAYQRYVSKQVNQALGDYLHMSPFERNVLRNAVPFYSWYRAITVTTAHLAADTPLRANILGQLGQIGRQWSDQKLGDVPSFLEGSIPLGPGKQGTQKVLATGALNPYATLEQLRRGATGDVTALGFNPFVTGAADIYAKRKYNGGVGPAQLAGGTLAAMLAGLPPSRLAKPPGPSKLYPTRNRRTAELGYLGLPIKEYDPRVAAAQKTQGR